ncbi:seryl-tRNA synthetase [Azorhizobium caulinodans ORS 571]|uniref:Seryl-tRNA synthetase n=1 Tax=Azorhizobium caulinodans (strain ATCC 43989 / DSM 5975 / JCM 20966 / LMG 6465 / NBRC 14845 / NCIMB 13405 / ORS 571) TaxID=438753 RepID=A8HWF9_AZOC5|nr:amino acid--[acyl-carrier-protein] ligase [Azorhizobium caulinodans]BAF90425.1 seryl-tRNA synthetase [Azorhizobium caulinodans ORS 571]
MSRVELAFPVSSAAAFRAELIAAGLLIPTGVDGLYGRGAAYETVADALEAAITRLAAADAPERMRFPPVMSRQEFIASGYLKGFPHLAGTVNCFCGNEADHRRMLACIEAGEDWDDLQQPSEVVVTPAACYPVYPVVAAQGPLAEAGRLVDVSSYCFRHEPSVDPCRMQMFRMRELVRIGSEAQVLAFRDGWMARASRWLETLGLPSATAPASDPFFGRGGKIMAAGQMEQLLKFELLVPVGSTSEPTACISCNYHMTHFSEIWPLRDAAGGMVRSGCVAFGIERLTLALFRHHGFDARLWPAGVRAELFV